MKNYILRFEVLESRITPVMLASRDGMVINEYTDQFFRAFPDDPNFNAAHALAANQFSTVIGAGAGGGPRVKILNFENQVADFFAFEDSFRGGVNVDLSGDTIVAGAAAGGGPVVAVYDAFTGEQRARFFAFDPAERFGVSVAIRDNVVYAVPGPGGGPLVKMFTPAGEFIGQFYGDDPGRRDGWDIIVGDVTHDSIDDVSLCNRAGRVSVVDGATGLRYYQTVKIGDGFTLAGYGGQAFTVGNQTNYERASAVWISFPTMPVYDYTDGAAGNHNPPKTTGTRPGVFHLFGSTGGGDPEIGDIRTFNDIFSSSSVGTDAVGTGSAYVAMKDSAGRPVIVTASHVTRGNPYTPTANIPPLTVPGKLDDRNAKIAGTIANASTITPNVPYVVDAAAFYPVPGVNLSQAYAFGNETVPFGSVATDIQPGSALIALGRGRFVGVGSVVGIQEGAASIRWPSGALPQITGQVVAKRGVTNLAVPGFSGGPVFSPVFVGINSIDRQLVGMTVAGNESTGVVFITPHAAIAAALGLSI